MYQSSALEYRERIKQLLREHLDELQAQPPELIVLDEFVQVGCKAFKDDTQVLVVDERVEHSKEMMLVVFVVFSVQLFQNVQDCDQRRCSLRPCALPSLTNCKIATSIIL